ncbi:MAG: glycoside hydrolase family 19 protein [Prevotella sp.]
MTKEDLLRICPSVHGADTYVPIFNKYMGQYGIIGRMRESAFIAQVLHESGCFRYTEEIASGRAYEFRKDLGNTNAGDGERYKGRGFIQITGKSNYALISKSLGVDFVQFPQRLSEPTYCVESACWFWVTKGLNVLADNGEFKTITQRINGGLNGYAERLKYYKKALSILK